jgi:hypothetical protein
LSCTDGIDVEIDRGVEEMFGSLVLMRASIELMYRGDVQMRPLFEEIERQDVLMIQGVVRSFVGLVEKKRLSVKTIGASEPLDADAEHDEPSLEPVEGVSVQLFERAELPCGLFERLEHSSLPDIGGSVHNNASSVENNASSVHNKASSERNGASTVRMSRDLELPSREGVVHEPDEGGLVLLCHLIEPRESGLGLGLLGLGGSELEGGHAAEGHGSVLDDVEVRGPEVAEVSDEEMVVLARLVVLGLAERHEVALVELKVGAPLIEVCTNICQCAATASKPGSDSGGLRRSTHECNR